MMGKVEICVKYVVALIKLFKKMGKDDSIFNSLKRVNNLWMKKSVC